MKSDELRESTLALQHFYTIDHVLERLPLGTLFTGLEEPFARPVHIWVLDKLAEMEAPREIRERLEELAHAAMKLHGSNHAKILDWGWVDPHTPFVVFEKLKGRSLTSFIARRGKLALWETLRVAEGMARALEECHQEGIEGVALNPGRVLVSDTDTMEVRLFGPGFALKREEMLGLEITVTPAMLQHVPPWVFMEQMGASRQAPAVEAGDGEERASVDTSAETSTPTEVPECPEPPSLVVAVEGDEAVAGDTYALAALLYTCLTGQHPYFREEREVGDGMLAVLRERPPRVSEHYELPRALDAVFDAALGKAPTLRTPAELYSAFRAAATEEARTRADAAARPAWVTGFVPGRAPEARKNATSVVSSRAFKAAMGGMVASLLFALFALGAWMTRDVRDIAEVPAFVPAAAQGEGTDVVITAVTSEHPGDPFAATTPVEADLYLVSTTGESVYVSQTPYILRNQRPDAQLRVVLKAEGMRPSQVAITVRDQGGQMMFVEQALEDGGRRTASLGL